MHSLPYISIIVNYKSLDESRGKRVPHKYLVNTSLLFCDYFVLYFLF